ncbi:winged-helix DNA-binding transcription factor family protein [Artemisia annua]|uniref:Winged-helix DNA-binding transcription factor family protein n=1 Tax=Artemisia annua TaxID=35608 RepID=A0A2U1MLS7_ARTAN|nr:winged-helix DNA-binding transcription factor family protein [Artemisia annua]
MSTEEPIAATEVPSTVEPTADDAPATEDAPAAAETKESKPKKAKKSPAARKPKSSASHPTYFEMISEAIVSLKERNGSSQYAIGKFIEDKHKNLPANFKKQLLTQLKKLVAGDKLVKSRNLSKEALRLLRLRQKAAPAKKALRLKGCADKRRRLREVLQTRRK